MLESIKQLDHVKRHVEFGRREGAVGVVGDRLAKPGNRSLAD
jgi:hypothetical protein